MHQNNHPLTGKQFRIVFPPSEAGFERLLDGKIVRLEDWADRMRENTSLTEKQIAHGLMFYAHRRVPDLKVTDNLDAEMLDLESVVYVTLLEPVGTKIVVPAGTKIVVLHESELVEC